MNQQREVIYKKRRHALYGDRISLDISNSIFDTCETIAFENQEKKDFEAYKLALLRTLTIESPVNKEEFLELEKNELAEITFEKCYSNYKLKTSSIAKQTFPVIKDVFEKQSATYKNIVIPFTDGLKTLQVVTNLKESFESQGANIAESIEKSVTLAIIDNIWKEHLREMDDLKQSVQNAVYEQKDPLLIYKFESFNLFKELIYKVNKEIVTFLLKAGLPNNTHNIQEEQSSNNEDLKTSRPDNNISSGNSNSQKSNKVQPVRVEQKTNRNDPCPCGSGKKFKKCHGK
jgi:preprotein translocase subunit SecA